MNGRDLKSPKKSLLILCMIKMLNVTWQILPSLLSMTFPPMLIRVQYLVIKKNSQTVHTILNRERHPKTKLLNPT
jgi:hypothetical protein